MTPDAAIRFFCLVLPNGNAQLGFDYLEALDRTGLGVRACPIGPAFLMAGNWPRLQRLFTTGQVASRYVNIVCAPPNFLMGQTLRAIDVKPPSGPGMPLMPPPAIRPGTSDGTPRRVDETVATSEVIYEPQTALSGLFTVGSEVTNIAITMPRPKPPDPREVNTLGKYDAVICPTDEDASVLRALGIVAFNVPPDSWQLAKIVRWVMG